VSTGDDTEFLHQVRDALAHLYDFAYLQRHPLAGLLVPAQAIVTRTRGQELRRILLDAIEALKPGDGVPIRAPERRAHAILFGLYVEGRPLTEVASSLTIGGRQLRRDRAAALEALAGILRDRYLPKARAANVVQEPLRQESERLASEREPVDMHEIVQGILPLLEGIARERGVLVRSGVGSGLPQLVANRTLMRQALIGLASQALTALPLAQLTFEAHSLQATVGVGLRLVYREAHTPGSGPRGAGMVPQPESVETLAAALGGVLRQEATGEREQVVWLLLPLQDDTVVLVVDDNQELFALFERYVAGQPYRLVHARGADEALALARALQPGIITIDLMMPHRDGWELLTALRGDPAAAHVPVIVCSVLDEPQLALSLGAHSYLKKPVGQAELLQALAAAKGLF
jgi:CheY-like chemotaxis protein